MSDYFLFSHKKNNSPFFFINFVIQVSFLTKNFMLLVTFLLKLWSRSHFWSGGRRVGNDE